MNRELRPIVTRVAAERLGADRIVAGWRCSGFEQNADGATAYFHDALSGASLPSQRGAVVIGCDGINSVVRKQLYPDEGEPIYSGVNMWRGVTRWKPFLSGACMTRVGWHATGKMVIYPIRNNIDAEGRQLINWVAELQTPQYERRDWNRPGNINDFIAHFADWHFDWLDVPALLRAADVILEFPMVDQDPLPRWSHGRVTLLGDAAHPMVPRGSNGAGQAILDARALTGSLSSGSDPVAALQHYEALRLETTANVVRTNRTNPPDAILREVYLRSGDKPFKNIEDVIPVDELRALSEGYKRVTGSDKATLAAKGAA